MKKDIVFHRVQGVSLAVVRKKNEEGEYDWYVYMLNKNPFSLTGVLVTSKGYGFKGEEKQKTSTLRHLITELPAEEYAMIERIDPSVFHLTSEYWVSYYVDGEIYDKKFLFVPDTIVEENLMPIEKLELEGVLHN
jgi:hypothetical protein